MHDKRKVSLGLRCKYACRRKPRIIDQKRIFIAFPFNGVRRIGYDGFKRLIVPVMGIRQRISQRDVELIVVNIMQKHIDTAEIVRCQVDFLPVEALTHLIFSENLGKLQKQ